MIIADESTLQLRCDVVTEPVYTTCKRCQRLGLECKIDSNFRRVEKRSKNAEMEREIVDLRRQLAIQQASSPTTGPTIKTSLSTSASPTMSHLPAHMDHYIGSEEAVASLMDLRSGLEGGSFLRSPNAQLLLTRRIGDIILTQDRVQELFQQYAVIQAIRIICLTAWQLFYLLPSFYTLPRFSKNPRRVLPVIFFAILGHH